VLRKQLGLPPGMGLVVDFVVPDSPAQKAGLVQYDVLQKLDDQLIINPAQLAVLVRSHKPGDEVKLGIIHEGKPVMLSIKLVEHELEPLADEDESDEAARRLRQLLPEPNIRALPQGQGGIGWGGAWSAKAGPGSVTWFDGGQSFSIVADPEGHKTFTEKDKEGKVLFQGLIDTKEQREKLSPEQKEKLERMEQHMPPGSPLSPWDVRTSPSTQPAK
jgi:hypothetical protein